MQLQLSQPNEPDTAYQNDIYDTAEEVKDFLRPLCQGRPVNMEMALVGVKKPSSSGFSFTGTKGQVLDDLKQKIQLEEYVRAYFDPLKYQDVECVLTLSEKDEVLENDKAASKSRLFTFAPFHHYIAMAMLLTEQFDNQINHVKSMFVKIGMSKFKGELIDLLKNFGNSYWECWDIAGMEYSVGRFWCEILISIHTDWLLTDVTHHIDLLRFLYLQVFFGRVWCTCGHILQKNGNLPSGYFGTTLDNSLMSTIVVLVCWKRLTGGDLKHYLWHNKLAIIGDNMMLSISQRYMSQFSYQLAAPIAYKCGFNLKLDAFKGNDFVQFMSNEYDGKVLRSTRANKIMGKLFLYPHTAVESAQVASGVLNELYYNKDYSEALISYLLYLRRKFQVNVEILGPEKARVLYTGKRKLVLKPQGAGQFKKAFWLGLFFIPTVCCTSIPSVVHCSFPFVCFLLCFLILMPKSKIPVLKKEKAFAKKLEKIEQKAAHPFRLPNPPLGPFKQKVLGAAKSKSFTGGKGNLRQVMDDNAKTFVMSMIDPWRGPARIPDPSPVGTVALSTVLRGTFTSYQDTVRAGTWYAVLVVYPSLKQAVQNFTGFQSGIPLSETLTDAPNLAALDPIYFHYRMTAVGYKIKNTTPLSTQQGSAVQGPLYFNGNPTDTTLDWGSGIRNNPSAALVNVIDADYAVQTWRPGAPEISISNTNTLRPSGITWKDILYLPRTAGVAFEDNLLTFQNTASSQQSFEYEVILNFEAIPYHSFYGSVGARSVSGGQESLAVAENVIVKAVNKFVDYAISNVTTLGGLTDLVSKVESVVSGGKKLMQTWGFGTMLGGAMTALMTPENHRKHLLMGVTRPTVDGKMLFGEQYLRWLLTKSETEILRHRLFEIAEYEEKKESPFSLILDELKGIKDPSQRVAFLYANKSRLNDDQFSQLIDFSVEDWEVTSKK
jgi:hypothetical protein